MLVVLERKLQQQEWELKLQLVQSRPICHAQRERVYPVRGRKVQAMGGLPLLQQPERHGMHTLPTRERIHDVRPNRKMRLVHGRQVFLPGKHVGGQHM
jgi:hypothetical protein